jgi:hypothetical protein
MLANQIKQLQSLLTMHYIMHCVFGIILLIRENGTLIK